MNLFNQIATFLKRRFTPQASIGELEAELHMRRPERKRHEKRKTQCGAKHKHRAAGHGRRRRAYLPAIVGFAKRRMRKPCRFAYARPDKQASRDARLRVITSNDRLENGLQRRRLEMRGLCAA